jgi:hypothetical protein
MMKNTVRNQVQDDDFQICTTLYWTRLLLDSYILRRNVASEPSNGKQSCAGVPLVIETQDLIVGAPLWWINSLG